MGLTSSELKTVLNVQKTWLRYLRTLQCPRWWVFQTALWRARVFSAPPNWSRGRRGAGPPCPRPWTASHHYSSSSSCFKRSSRKASFSMAKTLQRQLLLSLLAKDTSQHTRYILLLIDVQVVEPAFLVEREREREREPQLSAMPIFFNLEATWPYFFLFLVVQGLFSVWSLVLHFIMMTTTTTTATTTTTTKEVVAEEIKGVNAPSYKALSACLACPTLSLIITDCGDWPSVLALRYLSRQKLRDSKIRYESWGHNSKKKKKKNKKRKRKRKKKKKKKKKKEKPYKIFKLRKSIKVVLAF